MENIKNYSGDGYDKEILVFSRRERVRNDIIKLQMITEEDIIEDINLNTEDGFRVATNRKKKETQDRMATYNT